MKQSKLYQEILDEGVEKGVEKERRKLILHLLKARFGQEASNALSDPLEKTHDKDRLLELFDLAAHCADLSEFRRKLPW